MTSHPMHDLALVLQCVHLTLMNWEWPEYKARRRRVLSNVTSYDDSMVVIMLECNFVHAAPKCVQVTELCDFYNTLTACVLDSILNSIFLPRHAATAKSRRPFSQRTASCYLYYIHQGKY